MWRQALAEAGVAVDAVDVDHVRLWDDHGELVVRVKHFHYPIAPSKVPERPDEPGLLVLPRASARTMATAVERGWFVVTDTGAVSLTLGGRRIDRSASIATTSEERQAPGPKSWLTFTLARRLLAAPGASQTELAKRAGMSQPKVSRIFQNLLDQGLVERTADGWVPADWDEMVDWWLARYPGPGGTTSYWYSLDDLSTQAAQAVSVLTRAAPNADPVLSGDAAADLLAPWRRPSRAVLYSHAAESLASAGFVPVVTAEDATLIVVAAADPGVWLPRPWQVAGGSPEAKFNVADPLQVLFDVVGSGATDADEAATRLRSQLRGRLADRWRSAVVGNEGWGPA